MRNLTLDEIKKSKNFKEFCEMSKISFNKVLRNMVENKSSFKVELLDNDDEEVVDMNYPYRVFNPYNLDIEDNSFEPTYRIQDREAGNVIEVGLSYEEAQETLAKFEADDKENGTYTEDFYEIVQEN
jgi:hypothetical protein